MGPGVGNGDNGAGQPGTVDTSKQFMQPGNTEAIAGGESGSHNSNKRDASNGRVNDPDIG